MYNDVFKQQCQPRPNKSFLVFRVKAFWDNKVLNVPCIKLDFIRKEKIGEQKKTIVEFRSDFHVLQFLPIRFTRQDLCCISETTMKDQFIQDWKSGFLLFGYGY